MCFKINLSLFICLLLFPICAMAQIDEPDFVGDAYLIGGTGEVTPLDKELAAYTRGISWSANSFDAVSLEIVGGKARTRVSQGSTFKLLVRAVDNNSDPLSIITIYRLKASKKKRTTVLSENNAGTMMKSRTHTKNQLVFSGKKYGTSSYLITISGAEPGEYGIMVANPNSVDEKKSVVSCFGVD